MASIILTESEWLFFGLSTAPSLGMLYSLFKKSSQNGSNISSIMWFVLIIWSFFPIVWVLTTTGFTIIAVDVTATLYLALDILTKIGFGIYILTRK